MKRSFKTSISFSIFTLISLWLSVTAPAGTTLFSFNAGKELFAIPDFAIPVSSASWIVFAFALIATGFSWLLSLQKKKTPIWLTAIFAFALVQQILFILFVGQMFPVTTTLQGSLALAVPLIFGALAGVLSERVGVINIAIEGQLLAGAFASALITSITHSLTIGLLAAVYMSEYAGPNFRRAAKPLLEVLAGIPTVVYGFFALITIGPALRDVGAAVGLDISSTSVLCAGLTMGIMIIPFVSSLSDDIINAVPQSLRDAKATDAANAGGASAADTAARTLTDNTVMSLTGRPQTDGPQGPALARLTDQGMVPPASFAALLRSAEGPGETRSEALNRPQNFPITVPFDDPRFGSALSERVQWLVKEGIQSAELTLHPQDMGPIRIEMSIDGSAASIDFAATQADTRAAIEQALPRLRDLLADQGLQLGGAQIGADTRRQDHPSHRARPSGGETRTATVAIPDATSDGVPVSAMTAPGRNASGRIDLFA
jgi:ABC-type phosphate transport system permease subunit